ncbi:LacI family DNA-binding transcriptional regulator [Pseudaestuariivita atlantica]|uniref:LacI family transcriptional regulator n=1 Tax=Pseudaestuariivita atlantica TaxID=1317121 RepID=A0A0L1JPC1_9RHOB|nr:LacI family DNA-binding transcriptional regulator [Pseudaestuariivita atlantica]KNG93557.1 LacI family transcriptional regulator [Pseudaestuariivita atlantica]
MTHRFPIKEIARQAGLGPATVDRVLNGRAHVSPQARARVAAALDELATQEAQLAARGRRVFVDIIAEAPHRFSREIRKAAESIAPQVPGAVIRPRFAFQEVMTVGEVVDILERVLKRGTQGVCLKARDVMEVRAMVARLEGAGIPVVTLVTDLTGTERAGYVGLDNANAGRTAAFLIAQALRGEGTVLASRSQEDFTGEAARFAAFRETLHALAPGLRIVSFSGGGGVEGETTRALANALADQSRIDAVYSMGGGNRAILRVLDDLRMTPATFVAHDLDADNRALLAEGRLAYVLHHDLTADMARAFGLITARHGLAPAQATGMAEVQVVTRYNVPA